MRTVALVMALAMASCGYSAVGPRRTRDASVRPDCTRNADGRIALDVMGGVVWGLVGVGGLAVGLGSAGDEEESGLAAAGWVMALGGGLFSALHFGGMSSARSAVRACRAADAAYAARSPR